MFLSASKETKKYTEGERERESMSEQGLGKFNMYFVKDTGMLLFLDVAHQSNHHISCIQCQYWSKERLDHQNKDNKISAGCMF